MRRLFNDKAEVQELLKRADDKELTKTLSLKFEKLKKKEIS